jgi:quercetin dioxygenase-like cupin family protein
MSDSENHDDQHQKVHRFRQGDVIAVPAGTTHWDYNNGEPPSIVIKPIEEESEPQEKE